MALHLAEAMDYRGILTVEFFVLAENADSALEQALELKHMLRG